MSSDRMSKALLALFLACSLATQVASVSSLLDGQQFLHAPGQVRVYNTDFDDERRGLTTLTVAVRNLPFARANFFAFTHPGETLVDFCFARLPLFKLHSVLLI